MEQVSSEENEEVSNVLEYDKSSESNQVELEYNPINYRPSQQITTNSFGVFIHLFKSSFCTGLLFLPYAYRKAGYASATITCMLFGCICVHTAVILVQCSQILCRRFRVPSMNFAEVAEASFKAGPECWHRFAGTFRTITNFVICFVQYETVVVYTLYIAESFQQMIQYFFDANLGLRFYILAFLPIFCVLSLVPNFAYLVPLSIAGTICIFIGFAITLYYLFVDIPSPLRIKMFTRLEQVPICACIMMFALHNMPMLMPLENSMDKPQQMSPIMSTSMLINIGINMLFGFLGYNKYEDVCDTIIKNLPFEEMAAQIVKITIAFSVLFSYGLHYYIPVTILWPMIAAKIGNNASYETYFRLIGVVVCTLVALALPHMTALIGLFSALSMTTIMMLIPIIIETATHWYNPNIKQRNFILTKNLLIGVLWMTLTLFGSIDSIYAIIRARSGINEEAEICH